MPRALTAEDDARAVAFATKKIERLRISTAKDCAVLAKEAVRQARETLPKASSSQAMIIAGIATDKCLLLRGDGKGKDSVTNQVNVQVNFNQSLRNPKIAALAASAMAIMAKAIKGGQADEIPPPIDITPVATETSAL